MQGLDVYEQVTALEDAVVQPNVNYLANDYFGGRPILFTLPDLSHKKIAANCTDLFWSFTSIGKSGFRIKLPYPWRVRVDNYLIRNSILKPGARGRHRKCTAPGGMVCMFGQGDMLTLVYNGKKNSLSIATAIGYFYLGDWEKDTCSA